MSPSPPPSSDTVAPTGVRLQNDLEQLAKVCDGGARNAQRRPNGFQNMTCRILLENLIGAQLCPWPLMETSMLIIFPSQMRSLKHEMLFLQAVIVCMAYLWRSVALFFTQFGQELRQKGNSASPKGTLLTPRNLFKSPRSSSIPPRNSFGCARSCRQTTRLAKDAKLDPKS